MSGTLDPAPAPVSAPADERLHGIQEVAHQLGVTMRTLRFYEDKGLVEPRRVGATRRDRGTFRTSMCL